MPRKAKEETKKITKSTTAKEKSTTKKSTTTKTNSSTRKTASTKKTTSAKKTTTAKKSASTKKVADVKKSTSTKKVADVKKSTSTKKTTTTRKKVAKNVATHVEYYDLPSVYNKTMVKILAQTPSCLFVYWEISEKDKLELQKQYGEGFFQDTKPYLIVINETMNYSFETEINDYANSWYIHVNDSNCKYSVKLIRKPINHEIPMISSYVDITSSNEMDIPNNHILFDKLGKTIFFKNVKTNIVDEKNISSIALMSNIGRIYNIYDFYKEIYKNELDGDELGTNLSSSQFSSTYR